MWVVRFAFAFALCILGFVVPARAGAQGRTRPDTAVSDSASAVAQMSIDSLAARLERAEAEIELLRQHVATEASSAIRTRSRLQVEFWARVLVNGYSSTGPLNSPDVPTYATREQYAGARTRTVGFTPRQTRLGVSVAVDSVIGGVFDGDVDLDFFAAGGGAESYSSPMPRLRTARLTMRWPRTELLIGSETPLISPLNPVTVASVGLPGFSEAGNLWSWLPQVRITRDVGATSLVGTRFHWAVQGAVLHPMSGILLQGEEGSIDAGELSGRPYLQGRVLGRWGPDERDPANAQTPINGEVGVGVHRGWIRASGDSLTASQATSVDLRIGFRTLELRGEAYRGQALAGLGGGGIGQNFGVATGGAAFGAPLRDIGGWMQLNWQAHSTLLTGGGCGIDAADVDDRPEMRRNVSCAANVIWRPAQPLLFGVELRHIRTTYADRVATGSHLNFSFGFEL